MSRKTIKELQVEVEELEKTFKEMVNNSMSLILVIRSIQQDIATLKESDLTITQSMNNVMASFKMDSIGGDITAGDILRSYG